MVPDHPVHERPTVALAPMFAVRHHAVDARHAGTQIELGQRYRPSAHILAMSDCMAFSSDQLSQPKRVEQKRAITELRPHRARPKLPSSH